MSVLEQHYKIEEDWTGELYCGITIKWNYEKGYVDIFMPNYLCKPTRVDITLYPYLFCKGLTYSRLGSITKSHPFFF